jgi:hypothetical protein
MYIYSYITLILAFSRTYLLQKCLVYDKIIFFAQKEKGVMTIINYDTVGIPSRNVELGHLTLTSGTGNVVCWSCVLPWIIWFSSVYIMHIVKRKFKQWWSTIWRTITSQTHWAQIRQQHMTFEIQVLAWDRHKHVVCYISCSMSHF